MAQPEKTWWAPVWRGLVVDPDGKHVKRLKLAMSLLLYLIVHANRLTGVVVRKEATIAKDMGLSRWTIRAWMRQLHRHGYVHLTKTGRAMVIEIRRWRPVGRGDAGLMGTGMPLRGAEMQHPVSDDPRESQERRGTFEDGPVPNKNIVTRVIQRYTVVRNLFRSSSKLGREGLIRREELLARDLAIGLGDSEHLSRYLSYAERHPESLLRRLLSDARATPERSIKRSKAALFEFLLKQHVVSKTSSESNHPRD